MQLRDVSFSEGIKVIKPKEMQSIAEGRAKTYAVLAGLYSAPPSKELAESIRAGSLSSENGGSLSSAANELTACFRQIAPDVLSENDLVAEYTRLFAMPSGVIPYESFYTDENKRVGGHVTVAVQQYYDAAMAQLTGMCLESPDHIGVELEFMKFLCEIEAQFWEVLNWEGLYQCLDFQRGFLDGHLLRWHQSLCEKVISESSLELFRALARLTIDFLEAEREFVPELAEEVCSEGRTLCES
jgi:TorA maturation chaperone TorD